MVGTERMNFESFDIRLWRIHQCWIMTLSYHNHEARKSLQVLHWTRKTSSDSSSAPSHKSLGVQVEKVSGGNVAFEWRLLFSNCSLRKQLLTSGMRRIQGLFCKIFLPFHWVSQTCILFDSHVWCETFGFSLQVKNIAFTWFSYFQCFWNTFAFVLGTGWGGPNKLP